MKHFFLLLHSIPLCVCVCVCVYVYHNLFYLWVFE